MMHALKYQGRSDIARYLGDMLGEELRRVKRFGSADLVVPVPEPRGRGHRHQPGTEYLRLHHSGLAQGTH